MRGTPTERATTPATRSGWSAANHSDRHTPSLHRPISTAGSGQVAARTASRSATHASSVWASGVDFSGAVGAVDHDDREVGAFGQAVDANLAHVAAEGLDQACAQVGAERPGKLRAAGSSVGARPVSLPGQTTQTPPTTERLGRPPSPDTTRPCPGPATSTTAGSSPPSPAVPTWLSTHHIAVIQPTHPDIIARLKPGRPGHAHLADISRRIKRRHHHRHLGPLTRRPHERSWPARGLGGVKPQPLVLGQEPHHRQGWPPAAADGCHTRGATGLTKKAEHVEGRTIHTDPSCSPSPGRGQDGGRDRARTCDLVVVRDRTPVCRAGKTICELLDQCPC
jgi:hypothetical protein